MTRFHVEHFAIIFLQVVALVILVFNLMTQAQLAQKLTDIGTALKSTVDQLNKALAEIKAAIENLPVSAEVEQALAKLEPIQTSLGSVAQSLDDLNQDPPAGNG